MDFFGAALIKELSSFAKLGSADNGIVDEEQALVADERADRDQLHLRD